MNQENINNENNNVNNSLNVGQQMSFVTGNSEVSNPSVVPTGMVEPSNNMQPNTTNVSFSQMNEVPQQQNLSNNLMNQQNLNNNVQPQQAVNNVPNEQQQVMLNNMNMTQVVPTPVQMNNSIPQDITVTPINNNMQPNIQSVPMNNGQQFQGMTPNMGNTQGNNSSNGEGFFQKNKNLILILGVGAVLILLAWFLPKILLSKDEKDTELGPEEMLLSVEEQIDIVKSLYEEDVVRHMFNESVSYCGDIVKEGDDASVNINDFTYYKSATFHSFLELDEYVRKYFTDGMLQNVKYNTKITNSEGKEIGSYHEENGSLYCNYWNKGGDISRNKFISLETTYGIVDSDNTSINAKINAVYSSSLGEGNDDKDKKTIVIEIGVVKVNDNWLINSYEEVEE